MVAELIAQNRRAALGGERKDLTILFSDIENFTTWSEALSPEDLIAIMAFWGAPRELDDHATHACRAAIECIEFQRSLTAELSAEGFSPLNTRFGINSGEVLVGNVGYENRLNYTVLGDHVNLASRLEGLNKYYGANIIISDETARRVQGGFHVRALDAVAVKGKLIQTDPGPDWGGYVVMRDK